jgi:dihydropteroate synthase
VPVVKALRSGYENHAPIPKHSLISVDTFRAKVAAAGIKAGAGASRKSFIGQILDQPDPKHRVWGTAAACCAAIANGANIVRVHDLPEMWDVCRVADAIWK